MVVLYIMLGYNIIAEQSLLPWLTASEERRSMTLITVLYLSSFRLYLFSIDQGGDGGVSVTSTTTSSSQGGGGGGGG